MTPASLPGLDSLLAGLLPGDGNWPNAADLDLEEEIIRLAQRVPERQAALSRLRDLNLPPRSETDSLQQALEQLESVEPATFGALLLLAYGAYYAHPSVLALIEERCGYAARPPMPLGHPIRLDRPDPLPATAGGPPTWRLDGTGAAEQVQIMQAADPDRVWTYEEIRSWPTS